jgi:hypothetical protein
MDRALDALTIEKCGWCREKHVRFEPERNNPLLNGYNPAIILAWCASLDVEPVMSKDAALKCQLCSKQVAEILLGIKRGAQFISGTWGAI